MRLLSALPLTVLCILASLVAAIPYDTHCAPPAPWRRLANFIVERIWGPLPKASHTSLRDSNRSRAGRKIPGDFLARYGHDAVLRFNISTAEEARALSEAAESQYLDVWDFTGDWVDIRLAKNFVRRLIRAFEGMLMSPFRCHLCSDCYLRACSMRTRHCWTKEHSLKPSRTRFRSHRRRSNQPFRALVIPPSHPP